MLVFDRIKTSMTGRRADLVVAICFFILAFLIFGTALEHNFLIGWDDDLYVLHNPAVKQISLDSIRSAFSVFYVGNYAPVQILSYMLDHAIWGMKPAGFVLSNILLHIANAFLFYMLICAILKRKLLAAAAGLIFLVHPLQVESVVWIAQRKTLLAMFFFLAAFHQYIAYRARPNHLGPYLAALGLFLLAIASKPVAVVFPLAAHAFDCFGNNNQQSRRYLDKLPFLILAVAMVLLSIKSQSFDFSKGGMGGPYHQGGGLAPLHGGSSYATFLTMVTVVVKYLINYFCPLNLSAIYAPEIKRNFDFGVTAASLIVIVIGLLGVGLYNRNRVLFLWYLLFFITLLPVLQIIPLVTVMNDRYMYFPMLGISVITCATLLPRLRRGTTRSAANYVSVSVLALLVVAFGIISYIRTPVWKSSYTLWKDTVQKLPKNASVHFKLGAERLQSGAVEEAIKELRTSIILDPSLVEAHYNLGVAYAGQGRLDEAEIEFNTALRIDPQYAEVHFALGEILLATGRVTESLARYRSALNLNPDYAEAQHRAGLACIQAGLLDEAGTHLQTAVRIAPTNMTFHKALADYQQLKK